MNDIFQIVGSIASIVGIPLAIYLYLKGQVQKNLEVRREIVKKLSHQVGEGRSMGLFEINAIIASVLRERRANTDAISVSSILEDLVSEIISSPLLDSDKKDSVIKEINKTHYLGSVFKAIKNDDKIFEKFIQFVQEDGSSEIVNTFQVLDEIKNVKENTQEQSKTPEIFGLFSGALGLMGFIAGFTGMGERWEILTDFSNIVVPISLALGVAISIIAGIITALISRRGLKKRISVQASGTP